MDIQEIEQDGNVRMKIAKMMRELVPLVQRAYPGFTVYIDAKNQNNNGSTPVDPAKYREGFSLLPKRDQIATVLQAKDRPMQKQDIFEEIKTRGGNMSYETLSAYLTRYPCFQKEGGGLWSLNI